MSDTTPAQRNHPIQDLREWLERVEAIGELVTVDKPVERDEEMSAIGYLLAKQKPSSAVLFNKTVGFEGDKVQMRHLWNVLGPSVRRIAITLEEHPDIAPVELIRRTKDKLKRRTPPREVTRKDAQFFENTWTGDQIDLNKLPIPKHWPRDGGRYAGTADCVITKDPETGYLNVGTYRMMIQGKSTCGLYLSPGKDARLHIQKAWDAGKPIEVAACWGIDPLFMLVGSQSFPKTVSEYEYAGGIKGEPIPVVKGTATDLLVPASAEIVVEGVLNPGAMKPEGPFGEFTGYYGKPEDKCPLVEVKAVHFRNNPVLTNALMADYPSCEQSGFFSIIRSAKIWDDFDKLGVPGIHGVYSHPAAAGGFGMVIVSVEQKYAGHVTQVLALASNMPGSAYFTKFIVAVDHDVDPTDIDQVLWAMSTRCSPVDDIDIQRNSWSTPLDPSKNPPEARPYGSRVLINACKDHRYLNSFSVRTTLRKGVYDKVADRWAELGLPGRIPEVSSYEAATQGTIYKEEGQKAAPEPGKQGPEDKHAMKL